MDPNVKPDVVHDLNTLPLPFPNDYADEIHAYEVMEHLGTQGDWKFFFEQWTSIWHVLKHGGIFFGTSPHWSSPWAWMDPGHTRAIGPEMMHFLSQDEYTKRVGNGPMTDYRFCYKADFELVYSKKTKEKQYEYALMAVKPSRISI